MKLFIGLRFNSYLFDYQLQLYTHFWFVYILYEGQDGQEQFQVVAVIRNMLAEDMSETWCLKICCESHVEVNAEQHS